MKKISIVNNLTNKKEEFKPLVEGQMKIYACGITVYDHSHIGHAMQAIFFDVIRRFFEAVGYKVTYIRNHTDVDDKIIKRAGEMGIAPRELSESMIQSCDEDFAALECRPADFEPKVSDSIPEIVAMIEDIIKNEAGYVTSDGDVYFRVRSKDDYGKLSNRKPDDLRSGERDIVQGAKEDALDFALWKSDSTEGASWDSPWGKGRPGWHIECSAMSKKHLGGHFDIHGGGRDLIFPHHENEIAQSESANSCKYVNYWIHCGLMTIDKQKMSKSLGNHISIKDFLKDWPAEVLRFGILQNHYASNIDFSEQVFLNCHKRLFYYYSTILGLEGLAEGGQDKPLTEDFDPQAVLESFYNSMCDDLNTAKALGELNKEFKKANEWLKGKKSQPKKNSAKAFLKVIGEISPILGLLDKPAEGMLRELKTRFLPKLGITEQEISQLIADRKSAREAKDFARSDEIRDELIAKGIELRDTMEGTDWGIHYGAEDDKA